MLEALPCATTGGPLGFARAGPYLANTSFCVSVRLPNSSRAKYTPAGTPVHISAQLEDDFVRVTVDDEGPGLPSGDLDRVVAKFQRGSDEGTIVGAGIGLAICRAILRGHGGDIHAAHRPGGGARFELTLPTRKPPA